MRSHHICIFKLFSVNNPAFHVSQVSPFVTLGQHSDFSKVLKRNVTDNRFVQILDLAGMGERSCISIPPLGSCPALTALTCWVVRPGPRSTAPARPIRLPPLVSQHKPAELGCGNSTGLKVWKGKHGLCQSTRPHPEAWQGPS